MAEEIDLYNAWWMNRAKAFDNAKADAVVKRTRRQECNLELVRKGALQSASVAISSSESLIDEKLAEVILA